MDDQRETIIPHHYCVAGYKKVVSIIYLFGQMDRHLDDQCETIIPSYYCVAGYKKVVSIIYLFFACVWSMGAIFQNLSPSVTLKMGSRSPKSNQFLSLSQQYSCTNLVKIHPFILEMGAQKTFSNKLSPPVTLKIRSRSPKSNHFFFM